MVRIIYNVSSRCAGIVLMLGVASTACAGTFTAATGTNTSLGSAQLINPNPDLVLYEQRANYSVATAQAVSPQYQAYDVLGSINPATTTEYFAVPLNVGDQFNSFVQAGNPSAQFPELLLYNPAGQLVAIADGNSSDGSSICLASPRAMLPREGLSRLSSLRRVICVTGPSRGEE